MNRIAKFLAGGALTIGVLATAASAQASKLFDFTFSGSGGLSVSGEFVTGDTGSPFTITGITGTVDSDAINGLITGTSTYAGADNLLFYPGPPFVDFGGVSFSTVSLGDFNLFWNGSDFSLSSAVDPVGYGANGVSGTLSVTGVPEPAGWALLIVGFGGVGGLMRQGRRTAAGRIQA